MDETSRGQDMPKKIMSPLPVFIYIGKAPLTYSGLCVSIATYKELIETKVFHLACGQDDFF